MREEIILDTINWTAPEYIHKERHIDFYWTIGVVALIAVVIAIWKHNYVFAIFLALAGFMLIMFTSRKPEDLTYEINTTGIKLHNEIFEWKKIKGFDIIKNGMGTKLLIEIDKYFLPVYTIPLPDELTEQVDKNLMKVIPNIELKESGIMLFMEKIGF